MRSKLCIITIVACAALTGCSNVPDLSHVDNDLTAQYMAVALLKNDDSYQGVLDYDHSILEATPSPTAEPTPAVTVTPTQEQDTDSANAGSDGASTDNTQNNDTDSLASSEPGAQSSVEPQAEQVPPEQVYGIKGISMKAVSYKLVKSYGSSYANCTASKGKKLLVVQFSISNVSAKAKTIDLSKSGVQASIMINGQAAGDAMLSVVDEDLQHMRTKLAAGKKKQGVLLFEVDKGQKIDNVSVTFSAGQKQADVAVK